MGRNGNGVVLPAGRVSPLILNHDLTATYEVMLNNATYGGGGEIVTRRHVRSQQEWHCLPRWEPMVKDRC
jgi:hypothetical protein